MTPFSKTQVNPDLLPWLAFLIILIFGSNRYALILVSKFTVLFANSSLTNTDTAIIRNSRLVVFCTKGAPKNFSKITRKKLRWSIVLNEVADL